MRYISCFTQHMRSPVHPMAKSFSFFAVNETDVEAESTTKGSPGEPCLESSREFSSSHPISRSTYYAANGKDMGDLHDHIKSYNVTWRFRAGFHRKLNGHPTSNYAIITFFANRLGEGIRRNDSTTFLDNKRHFKNYSSTMSFEANKTTHISTAIKPWPYRGKSLKPLKCPQKHISTLEQKLTVGNTTDTHRGFQGCLSTSLSQLHDITHSWKLKKGLVTSHDVNCIIKDHASRGDLKGVLSLLSELRSNGFAITKENYNNILIAFQNVYTADTARYICLCLIADGMSPDLTTYTFLIKAHVLTGDVSSAFNFYRKMERAGIRADLTVYTTLIDGLVGKGLLDNAWRLYGYIRTWRLIQPDVHLFTTMIKASAHSGDTHRAVSLYDEMLQLNISPTSHTYEALIHCCSREKCYAQRCLEFYDRMRCNDTPITHDTLIHLLKACKNIGNTRKAMDVLRDASDQGINIDENILAAAINVMLNDSFESTASYFRKTEGVRKACCLVRSLLTLKKVVTTKVMNTIMEVYENAGYYDYAVAAYNYFHRLGVEPDHQSHTILLRIFGEKLRDPCRFFAVWQTVRDYIKPGREFLNVALDMAMLSNSAKRTLYILEHMYESKTHPLPELAATLHIKGRNIPQIHLMINRLFCLQKSLSYEKKQKDHQMMQTFLDENRLYYAN